VISSTALRWQSIVVAGCMWKQSMSKVSGRMLHLASLPWARCAAYGSPSYFQFERKAPVHTRLGAGVTRVSDSFWPLADW
jgi:hypothetical protein